MKGKKTKIEGKEYRFIDPGIMLVLVYMSMVCCLVLIGSCLKLKAADSVDQLQQNGPIEEQVLNQAEGVQLEEVQRGELLVVSQTNSLIPSPLLSQQVHIAISGITARVKVRQEFVNRSDSRVEAIYVFPLPDESAIDNMRMQIGEKVVVGRIEEKERAKATYQKAKNEGRKSSLLLQNRPNIFTTRVANIGPREIIVVELEYQQTVRLSDEIFSLRFPMVVGSRYIPGTSMQPESQELANSSKVILGSNGWAVNSEQVPDASEITPPVGAEGSTQIPVQLTIDLAAGISLTRIESLYHVMWQEKIGEGHYRLEFTGDVVADRDFVLEWHPKILVNVEALLFTEKVIGDQYMLLMLMPPQARVEQPIPRELIFILDISGSMAGTSIRQARSAISLAVSRLRPVDRFNIIVFNNKARALFPRVVPAHKDRIDQAQQFISTLQPSGGTVMKSALLMALDGSHSHERLRQVVFLTDGAVGNEDELLQLIFKRLGDSRLFTVGIGSAPNSYFMSRSATIGRGSHVSIGKESEVAAKMSEMLAKIENPVVSDLRIRVGKNDVDMEIYPSPIPDLYHGEPLVVALKSKWEISALQISGKIRGKIWQTKVEISTHGERPGIAALWARKKIRSLMESRALGKDKQKVRENVIATALEHHLVSSFTSLVAVDDSISRTDGKPLPTSTVKTHMVHGGQHQALFGGGARTGSSSGLRIVVGIVLTLLSVTLLFRSKWCWRLPKTRD